MLPTPSTSHVNYDRIYEPAEDSFLMIDTLASQTETNFLRDRFRSNPSAPLVLEVGTGSGVVLAFITTNAEWIFSRSDVATVGTDLNSHACAASHQTVKLALRDAEPGNAKAGTFLGVVNGDLTTSIGPGSVDVLVFNPPYVPSESLPSNVHETPRQDQFALDSYLLSLSTDGGTDGMESTNSLLADLHRVLTDRGVAFILLCAQNNPEKVIESIRAWSETGGNETSEKWFAKKVSSSGSKAGWERLCVLRIWRDKRSADMEALPT